MGVINGTPVNASNTNAAFLNKNQADSMTFPLALTSNLSLSKRDESSAATVNALVTTSTIVRITGTVTTLNGAVAPVTYADGQVLIVSNASASSITINHESGSATAENRFSLPGSTLLTLNAGQAVQFYYDTTAARWRAAAGSGAGGGGASAWATSYPYKAGDSVQYSQNLYLALSDHTSGATFEADFASGRWRILNRQIVTKNLMDVGSNFESNSVGGWQLVTTTLTGVIPTGAPTIGSAASITVAATSSSPLSGSYSLAVGNVASTNIAAGQGIISQAFSIDLIDRARVLATRFAYKANANTGSVPMNFSGTSSNTWAVYLYDVTNSVWIQPAGVYNLTQSSGVGIQTGTWQTPSNMTQFRLAILCVNATTGTTPAANAYQMYFDDFYVGPQAQASGPFIGDWQDFPSVAAGTLVTCTTSPPTYGTVQHNKAQWRRVGSDMEIRWDFRQNTSGTAGSGTYLFNLPTGYQMDTSKVTISASNDDSKSLGVFDYKDGATIGTGYPVAHTATSLRWVMQYNNAGAGYGTGTINSAFGQLTNALVEYSIKAKVPILGWSSNSVQSADTDTRIIAFRGYLATNQAVTADVTKIGLTSTVDTAGGWSVANSTYTIQTSGTYRISARTSPTTATGGYIRVFKNGSSAGYISNFYQSQQLQGTFLATFSAGDVLDFRSTVSCTLLGDADISTAIIVERLTGPATISATETVAASYWLSANQAITAAVTTINFDSKEFDTHGAVTTGASWQFLTPIAGTYLITGMMVASSACNCVLYKNGVIYKFVGAQAAGASTANGVTIKLIAGDVISFRGNTSVTVTGAASLSGNPAHIGITRIGN